MEDVRLATAPRSPMQRLLRTVLGFRLVRFGMAGGVTLCVNLAAIYGLVELLGMKESEFKINVAHFLAMELSILFAFHAHSYWTWHERTGRYLERLWQFHLFTALTIGLRAVGFYVLNRLGQAWIVSTMVPLAVAILVNFLGYDRLIFRGLAKGMAAGHEKHESTAGQRSGSGLQ